MKSKRIHSQLLLWLMTVIILICLAQQVFADTQGKEIVKVGYFDADSYYAKTRDGIITGYDAEYLNKIEDITNLKFEYVNCETWSHALEMLSSHQVDLLGTMQWNPEREDLYDIGLEGYGYTVGELAALPERNYVYEDYEQIDKSVVGCVYNYARKEELVELFKEHDISPTMAYYENQEDLEDALKTGEIHLIAVNSHITHKDWTVVEKFSFTPFYFATWKGNERLTNKIDSAIISIKLRDPEFDDQLLTKYFSEILGAPLTKEELDLIAENKTYTIYYDEDVRPLAWYDEQSDSMRGALVDACGQISSTTGLKIKVRPIREFQSNDETSIKYTTLFHDSEFDLSNDEGVTNSLIEAAFNLYRRIDEKIDLNGNSYSIGIVKNRNLLKAYVSSLYPNCTMVECNSARDCIKKLEAGDIDLAYMNLQVADNALSEEGITDIRELPQDIVRNGIGMQFEGENKELLASIVNKGIQKLDNAKLSDALVQYSLETHTKLNFRYFMQNYTGLMIVGFVFIALILMVIAIAITYANVMKKEKNKVEKADAEKTEFFARMSHDMRTPMNGILGMISLSEDSTDIEDVHENMKKAKSAGVYMLSLINDTLDLQRLESKKLILQEEPVYLKDYLKNFVTIMKVSADAKNIKFVIDRVNWNSDQYVLLDPIRFNQILSNLGSNAIKFTPSGGIVEVKVEALGEDGDILHRRITFSDTGVGMSQDFINNRLFKPYSQENNIMSQQLTGSGLGMAITKNLVELMHGTLEVESELGEGTKYTLTYDMKRASKEEVERLRRKEKEESEQVLAEISGTRILLCEDHPLNAEIAMRLLKKAGCEVTWEDNGKLGVERFEKEKEGTFDLILMDIRMPEMNGLQATRAIRALDRPDAKTIPIVAMTANAYDSDVQNCKEAGMNAHVAKPVSPMKLYSAIRDHIELGNE